MANLFQTLELEAFRKGITPRTKESREWFMRRVKQLGSINRKALMREDPLIPKVQFIPGNMFMFFYDPKHKETLPYYDKFPLIIAVDSAKNGFYGMNLHYLPLTLRAKFLDALLDTTNNKRYDDKTKFDVNYQALKAARNMRYFKPCFKHYLTNHVKSNLAMVPPPEWEIATFLPTAQWAKQDENTIHRHSRRMI